jgi:hypothetical protein
MGKPPMDPAGSEKPYAEGAYSAAPAMALPHLASDAADQERGLRPARAVPVAADRPRTPAPLAVPAVQIPGQGTLDLGGGVA